MRAANSDFTRCSIPKARQNHCLPPASAGNGQLRIISIPYDVCNEMFIIEYTGRTGRFS